MIENKSNILKTFQGQKIDESVHVARWATTINNNNQDSSKNIFMKYAAGSSNNTIPQNTSDIMRNQNIYQTQQSQVHEIDTGFKKLKNNQIQMLKQLKQQYQVLRTLNIQTQNNINNAKVANNMNSHSQSSASLQHQNNDSQILSSSSRHKNKKKSLQVQNFSSNDNRQIQILLLQKKQLQMIINNSMKKIQQLLHSQMQYKKQIHELKIQSSSRQNTDIEYETMLKTLKRNEINVQQSLDSLKRQNEKIRTHTKQLNEKINSLETEIYNKQQEIRKIYDQKRKAQDLIRIQKDRYFNLDIDYKKTKMQYELLQKQKNGQINRLSKQLQFKDTNKIKQLHNQIKRYEDDIQIKDKRYSLLLNQLEELKRKNIQIEHEFQQFRNVQQAHILDKEHVQELLKNFKDENDSSSFNRNINEVIQKLHEMENNQNAQLKQQIQDLKDVIASLKDLNNPQNNPQNNINFQLYERKIQQLQNNLLIQIKQKQTLKQTLHTEIRRVKIQNQDLNKKLNSYQSQLQEYQSIEDKLRKQIREQRTRRASVRMEQSLVKTNQVFNQNNQKKISELEQQLKLQKRRADENQFKVSKVNTELSYKLKMQQNQHNLIVTRINEDLQRTKRDYNILRQQYQKYKQSSQSKLISRQRQFQSLRVQLRTTSTTDQSTVSNLKLHYQSLLQSQRQSFRKQQQKLTDQITSLTKINQKYMLQTNKYVHLQNQLSLLRDYARKSVYLSSSVDHLWRIKETEYENVDQILRKISRTWK